MPAAGTKKQLWSEASSSDEEADVSNTRAESGESESTGTPAAEPAEGGAVAPGGAAVQVYRAAAGQLPTAQPPLNHGAGEPGQNGLAVRMMGLLELQEQGRQAAMTRMAEAQDKSTNVLERMMQMVQEAQSMRRLREMHPEAHRLLDAPRKRDGQKRRRLKQKTAKAASKEAVATDVESPAPTVSLAPTGSAPRKVSVVERSPATPPGGGGHGHDSGEARGRDQKRDRDYQDERTRDHERGTASSSKDGHNRGTASSSKDGRNHSTASSSNDGRNHGTASSSTGGYTQRRDSRGTPARAPTRALLTSRRDMSPQRRCTDPDSKRSEFR
jgi:hypothetical protein